VVVSTLKLFIPKLVILISPGKKIRQTNFTDEFGLLERLRYSILCLLAGLGVSEAPSFNSEETLQTLNEKEEKPPIFSLHGTEDKCILVQHSRVRTYTSLLIPGIKIIRTCPRYMTLSISSKLEELSTRIPIFRHGISFKEFLRRKAIP
jgi:hypothetical protein